MKKLSIILVIILSGLFVFGFCLNQNQVSSTQVLDTSNFLRIHIKANSEEALDQSIKYKIKDEFVNYLTPMLAYCQDKQQALNCVKSNLSFLNEIANRILQQNNLSYSSKTNITNEFFPTRSYDGYVLPSGYYDTITVSLGEGSGNNWWCVVYPPLCFTNNNSQNIVYKSKIMEIINKFFN